MQTLSMWGRYWLKIYWLCFRLIGGIVGAVLVIQIDREP
jgi:hypothetical protein